MFVGDTSKNGRTTSPKLVAGSKGWANGLAPRPASWPEKPPYLILNPKRATKATLGGLKRIVAIGQHSIGWVGNTIGEVSPDPVFENVGEPAKKRANLPPFLPPFWSKFPLLFNN
ncbi:MAG: hypothetical protein DWI24_09745 [Planctomycetota bacterium]|nr:MAG: hypothetical protein DWI24_09745 [Planctomycetota bacterium]